MKVDKYHEDLSGGSSNLDVEFTDPAGKHHAIHVVYGFTSADVMEATFDDQGLKTLPEWRALGKYLDDESLSPESRALEVLQCTHARKDHAGETNPRCKGWQ